MENMDALVLLNEWLEKAADPDVLAELRAMRDAGDEEAVRDAFFQELEFGTAGLRGIVGAGTNRMNIYTVGRATQGFADYLNRRFDSPSVAIARDSRNKGELFVKVAAGVLAANGVLVHVYPRIEPTPALSWAVRDLGCSGGICMTASHNPAAYNGYKAYGPDGCQITTQASRDISDAIAQVDAFADVKTMEFEEALACGKVSWIGEDVLDRYVDAVLERSMESLSDSDLASCGKIPSENAVVQPFGEDAGAAAAEPADSAACLKVVYTPLHGTGLECVSRVLEGIGVKDLSVVASQACPDGNFPTCPYPNPEVREALLEGLRTAQEEDADILIATDPDADRMGVAVRDDGEYKLLSGNEIGVLLLDFVARRRCECGQDLTGSIAVTTIVSSTMVDALAAEYGFQVKRVLTGFKYIGEQIGILEESGEESRFIFGFEESYGYLSGPHVRDKDAVNASMLFCQMARYHKARGLNLMQAMRELYERHGFYGNRTISLEYPGAAGAQAMARIMASLREEASASVADMPVRSVVDYFQGINGLPVANVMEFGLGEGNKVIVRPSGTEPKIKVYLFAKASSSDETLGMLDAMEESARTLLA